MHRKELERYLNQLLDISRFRDYCPNGLQVEGRNEIFTIISGVTASLDFLQAAANANADAVLVHHGYFWRGENERLTGIKRARIAKLITQEINLFAYHLPLDFHQELGNNVQLGHKLGFIETNRFGEQDIAAHGKLITPVRLGELGSNIALNLSRNPMIIGNIDKPIHRVAWCTGAAQNYFDEAISLGVDVFITGEISEQNVHSARESGVAFIAAGHHATERYGILALGEHIAQKFDVTHQFIDIDSPV